MAGEAEAAGALIEAGLVAASLERGQTAGDASAAAGACANCQTALSGNFCSHCGQPARLHHSLLRLGEEVAHGMMRFDAKGWRTLPMLVAHPGQLTRRYIDGQRARFVSPLGLFLFMIFLMFFVMSLTTQSFNIGSSDTPQSRERTLAKFEEKAKRNAAEVERALAARDAAVKEGRDSAAAERKLQAARTKLEVTQKMVESTKAENAEAAKAASSAKVGGDDAPAAAPDKPDSAAGKTRDEPPSWFAGVHTGVEQLDASIKHAAKNPELALYKVKNTAYKFAFMLVPISLPFLWVLFIFRRGVTLYDHAVFTLYSLSFMSLLFSLAAVCAHFGADGVVAALLLIAPPLHMYAQLRGTYQLGRWGGLWRTAVLLVVALIVFVLFLLFVLALSLT